MTPLPRPHPRNRGFEFAAVEPPFSSLTPEQARAWNQDGGFIVRGLLSAEEVGAARAAIDPLEARTDAFLRTREGGNFGISRAGEISFTPHLVTRCPLANRLSRHPAICALALDLIGPQVRLYWDQAVYKRPGTREEFPWHQDNGYTYVEPQQYLTCWIALSDATLDNGCPWILPGMHLQGTLEHRPTALGFCCLDEAEGAVPMPLAAGDAAIFSSLTPHRTGPNLSTDVRAAYILQYAPDGARAFPQGGDAIDCDASERQYPVLVDGVRVAD